ncbi:uncharacterized protein [Watersipora subatra]|uniref:uncharacterized protein n=1 Tax=Watersipora subatra TaxID=2589382 RepID=UPI00355BF89D
MAGGCPLKESAPSSDSFAQSRFLSRFDLEKFSSIPYCISESLPGDLWVPFFKLPNPARASWGDSPNQARMASKMAATPTAFDTKHACCYSWQRNSAHFAAGLLRIGEGHLPVSAEDGLVSLEGYSTFVDSNEELQEKVYPNLRQRFQDVDWLSERAILCPRNNTAAAINSQLLAQLPGNLKTFTSVGTSLTDDAAVEYPVEFLNSLDLPGLTAHKLPLQIETPIMLLRNLNPPKLCNGTWLIVRQMFLHLILAKIISAPGRGESVFIPRIPIIPTDLSIEFKKIQFPIRV